MKSENVTFWQILKHIFGFHTWSETRSWRHPEWGSNPPSVYFQNCELCGRERQAYYNGQRFYWRKLPRI